MSPISRELAAFLDSCRVGVLATVSSEGRPRQSLVYFARQDDRLLITTEARRWKAKDVARTGWASLSVRGDAPPFPSATLAGPATIVTEGLGTPTALVSQRAMGLDEPPAPQPEAALAAAGRVILVIDVERIGPVTYVDLPA